MTAGRSPSTGSGRGRPDRGRRIEQSFACELASVPAARHLVAAQLGDLSAAATEAVTLMVSEIATNCVVHARTGFELLLVRAADHVRVEVTDHGTGLPTVQSPDPLEPTGRGLRIVEALATEWGVHGQRRGRGHTVWFSYGLAGSDTPTAGHRGARPTAGSH